MKILGIDTTSKFLCLGLCDGDGASASVYGYNLEVGTKLSSLLGVTIKRTLDTLGWAPDDIDYFACGLGPGSFTGMRVGLAVIKGLAWSLRKPVAGISTLDILVKNVNVDNAFVVPVIDAKRNLVYCSIYKVKGNKQRRKAPYMLLTEKDFFQKIKKISYGLTDNVVILGDAVAVGLHKEKMLMNIGGAKILDKDYWYPKAHNIITLALERIKNKEFISPFNIKPIYLYPKECQIRKAEI